MATNKDSGSIQGSDTSDTAIDPDSSKSSPTDSEFARGTTNRDVQSSQSGQDVPKDLKILVPGWPYVAKQMAETPDFTSFARFRDLNVKSLLYYQAQLTKLRIELHKQEWNDNRSVTGDARVYAESAGTLIDSEEDKTKDQKQWKLIQKIRKVLREYNEALLQYSQVSALPEPESCNMKTFRIWLRSRDFDIMGDGEQHTWGNLYKMEKDQGSLRRRFVKLLWSLVWPNPSSSDDLDLVAIRPPKNIDGFTRWVAGDFFPYYNDFCEYMRTRRTRDEEAAGRPTQQPEEEKPKEEEKPEEEEPPAPKTNTLSTYSESGMLKFTSSVSTVVACLLPTVAIIVLAQVQGMRNLLLCLVGFAVIFSTGLIFLTSGTASRIEIFTATAAFSAVLVVFISTPVVNVQE